MDSLPKRRRLLLEGESAVYHVMSRTALKEHLFGPKEKEVFCALLRQQADFCGIEVLTFCVMRNHFHILARVAPVEHLPDEELLRRYANYYGCERVPRSVWSPEELGAVLADGGERAERARNRVLERMGNLPAFMRELKQRFTIWFNAKHSNDGTVWGARYKSVLVEDDAATLAKVAAYIDLNPVRAGIAGDPADYRWCGYAQAVAGVREAQKGVSGLFASDQRTYTEAMRDYRLVLFGKGYLTKGTVGKDEGRISAERMREVIDSGGALSLQELLRVRARYFSDGMILGSKAFLEKQFAANRELFGRRRKRTGRPLPGGGWDGLHVMRDLKRNVFP